MGVDSKTILEKYDSLSKTSFHIPKTETNKEALKSLLSYVEVLSSKNETPIIVFDLDSTLFHTSQRNFQILVEFTAHFFDKYPHLSSIVDILSQKGTGWNIVEDVKSCNVTDTELLTELRQYWRERFFTNEYLRHDIPLNGSPEFVRSCHDKNALCYYLTGRDVPNMKEGTEESLRRHGFPMGKNTLLHMKNRFEDDDFLFKQGTLEDLKKLGNVVGVFENEPANANMFKETFPNSLVFFLETIHSPGAPPVNSEIYRIKDFTID